MTQTTAGPLRAQPSGAQYTGTAAHQGAGPSLSASFSVQPGHAQTTARPIVLH